ncbi:hypothetical protein ACGF0J_11455 [Nonomuraea sp. NPDC047897]|uniref:hypothetical protein n=1 Tax=Nonomuraea sp. NPDC047897 TaxID=3364346 RepID=UPI0037178D64
MMLEAAENVNRITAKTPVVDDWGWFDTPRIISPFLGRLNGYVEEWTAAATTLQRVLTDDAPKLIGAANKYRDAADDAGAAVDQINR